MITLSNVKTRGDEETSPSIEFTLIPPPEAKSTATGVSVRYVHDANKKWFVFRASYGREDKAANVLLEDGTYTYVAKRLVEKEVNGRRKKILETLIPNLLFAYTTAEKAEEYTKKTPRLSFLTYYYNHFEQDDKQKNPPLTISCYEMENFICATCNHNENILFVNPSRCHYKSGDKVKVTEGLFKGVEGRVARVAGQQRVVLSLSQIGLISTAYVPTAFIKKIGTE